MTETIHTDYRQRLPTTRDSITMRREACGFVYFLTVGFYEESSEPGEVFCRISKEGSDLGGLMDSLVTTISIALQYHVPWKVLRGKYFGARFGHLSTKECPSLVHSIAGAVDCAIERRTVELRVTKTEQSPNGTSDESVDA